MRENFLIVNFLDDYLEATTAKADFSKKKLEITDVSYLKNHQTLYPLKKIFSTSFYPKPYNIIFVLNPRLAATNYDVISLGRDNPQKPLNEADLDNLISKALWKFFDESRANSAKQLGLNDLEILLSDVQVYDLKIDGHHLINPFRHSAKKIEISLSQTFTQRSFFKELLSILPKRAKLGLAVEGGTAACHLLSRITLKDKFFFAKTMTDYTNLFLTENGRICFFDYFNWGKNHFYLGVARNLRVNLTTSQSIIDKFIFYQTSLSFRRQFKKIFLKEIMILLRGLKAAASRIKNSFIYVDFLPLTVSLKGGLKLDKISYKMILPVDLNRTIVETLGFELISRRDCDFLSLAALMEFYFLPRLEPKFLKTHIQTSLFPLALVNHLAKRRMKWLTP